MEGIKKVKVVIHHSASCSEANQPYDTIQEFDIPSPRFYNLMEILDFSHYCVTKVSVEVDCNLAMGVEKFLKSKDPEKTLTHSDM